jgi:hypothetical protein
MDTSLYQWFFQRKTISKEQFPDILFEFYEMVD